MKHKDAREQDDSEEVQSHSSDVEEQTSTCYLVTFTITVIIIGYFCGSITKTFYNAYYVNDAAILNSDKVHWKEKLADSVFKSLSHLGSWERPAREVMDSIHMKEGIYSFERRILYVDSENTPLSIPVGMYHPTEDSNLPIIMYFHGGGWSTGSITTHDRICRHLSKSLKAIVVAVDYRLAPEHIFPAAFNDCYEATKWVYENSHSINGDKSRLIVMGDSAGGNLAAAVALENHDKHREDFRLLYQALIYPATNLLDSNTISKKEYHNGYIMTAQTCDKSIETYTNSSKKIKEDFRCSPYLYEGSLKGLPSALVMTSEFDVVRSDGENYAKKLEMGGVIVRHERYQSVHAFLTLWGGFFESPESSRAMRDLEQIISRVFEE